MSSYGFSFRASLSTRKPSSPGKLYLRIVHGALSRSVTTPYRIFPDEWDNHSRRLIIPYGHSERARQLADIESRMLSDLRRMEAAVRELERYGEYTVDELMTRYRSVMTGNTLCTYSEKLAAEMERKGYNRTANAYRSAAARLRAFNNGQDINIDRLSAPLLTDFQQSLKDEGKAPNTISFYMRTIRAIYHKAIAEGRTPRRLENIFSGVYTGVATTRKLALSAGELAVLSAYDPTADVRHEKELPERLGRALAMFLFCYHARGMCFVDMAHLKKSDLRGDTITYRRQKTDQQIELRVLPAMRRIIDWFTPYTVGSSYLFTVISDDADRDIKLQYESGLRLQNQHLGQLAAFCGIRKRLSSHSARHSWATVAKGAGLPLAVISEGLGHSNQKTTEIYLASLERSVLDHAAKVVSEAIAPAAWPQVGLQPNAQTENEKRRRHRQANNS